MAESGVVVQFVRFTFAPEDTERAEALLHDLRDASGAEPGVIEFEVARGQERSNVFVLWEKYRDGAAFDAHRATPHYERLVINGVRPLAKERAGELFSPIP